MILVKIQGKEYPYRYDFGAILHYEQLAQNLKDKGLQLNNYTNSALMHYACLLSGEDFSESYEGFLAAIDTRETFDALNAAFDREYARWEGRSHVTRQASQKSKKK